MHWYTWWKICYPKNEGGMGFRDLYSFNLAMLSKQCWRLITNPESLCARVLKAKYFPNSSLLQATLKNDASFTWQSIMKGLETFKLGYNWRIGTGERINIWSEPWVPASPDRRVISPRGHTVLTLVSDLIDPSTGQWDEGLLQTVFNPVDVGRILQIPLNLNAFDDFIAWHPERKGYSQFAWHTEYNGCKLLRHVQISTKGRVDQMSQKYGLHYGNSRSHVKSLFFAGELFMVYCR